MSILVWKKKTKMIFSSISFIFIFLPIVLIGYFICSIFRIAQIKNIWLLVLSFTFYWYGGGKGIKWLIICITINYVAAVLIGIFKDNKRFTITSLVISTVLDIGILFFFKCASAAEDNGIVVPLGISFFTFQAISYVVDVYRGDCNVLFNPLDVALYISMFPQLIAGPIVRYSDVESEIYERHFDLNAFIAEHELDVQSVSLFKEDEDNYLFVYHYLEVDMPP